MRAVRTDVARRLADPRFAELTRAVSGAVAIRQPSTPEAVTATIDAGTVSLAHGVDAGAELVAILADDGGPAEIPGADAAYHPRLTAWPKIGELGACAIRASFILASQSARRNIPRSDPIDFQAGCILASPVH